MNSMDEIQRSISQLTASERNTLASWLLDSGASPYSVQEAAPEFDPFADEELVSVDEYLKREEQSPIRHEYVGGRVYAMSGTTLRHNVVTRNMLSALSRHLAGGPCQPFMIDVKVRFQVSRDEIFYYPDLVVACGSLNLEDKWLRTPKLVIEVLSPSTASIDRREKAFNYMQIDSLEEYVIVAQATPDITLYRRSEGWKAHRSQDLGEVATLSSISLRLPLASVYESVFEA